MKRILIVLIGVLSYSTISAQKYTDQYIKDASAIAIKWVNDLNHKQYDTCWKLHSDEAKTANGSFENWQAFIDDLMQEFGYLKTRTITNAFFLSQIEGKEDGFYVFVEYECNYEFTKEHKEVVVLKQNDQAIWKIDSWEYQFASQEVEEKKEE